MTSLTLSLWLPISRANFYSPSGSDWLERRPYQGPPRQEHERWFTCRSALLDNAHYRQNPFIVVDVLRRLLEVLPVSFGYDPHAAIYFRGDVESADKERRRPSQVELTLDVAVGEPASLGPQAERATRPLRMAGVTRVLLVVNENGYYTFIATANDNADAAAVKTALHKHITEVFGGEFTVHPTEANKTDDYSGSRNLMKYNGLREVRDAEGAASKDPEREGPPIGVLSFYQLHVLAEGIWNDQLLPAVFLEHPAEEQSAQQPVSLDAPVAERGMAQVIRSITTDVDATTPMGQIKILHYFLSVTSQTSLHSLGMSLESVRRQLLDEMVGAMHRHSRLSQLNLSSNLREMSPEIALNATSFQLKGYSTVVAAKIPLIAGVEEVVRLAKENLDWQVEKGVEDSEWLPDEARAMVFELSRLKGQLAHWSALVKELDKGVASLEQTIDHTRMDQMLYEQQQARSDQEAIAEIERGRVTRPDLAPPASNVAYNLVSLLLSAAAVVFAVTNTNFNALWKSNDGPWHAFLALWPLWATIVFAYGVLPLIGQGVGRFRRAYRAKRAKLRLYPYEFAIQIGENVDFRKLMAYADDHSLRPLRAPGIKVLYATNRGFGRAELLSRDSRVLKLYTAGALRLGLWKYAHFEIIHEVLVHRMATKPRQILSQCRIFGESPERLSIAQIEGVLKAVFADMSEHNIPEQDLATKVSGLAGELFRHRPASD